MSGHCWSVTVDAKGTKIELFDHDTEDTAGEYFFPHDQTGAIHTLEAEVLHLRQHNAALLNLVRDLSVKKT